jgi:hypothetical protein
LGCAPCNAFAQSASQITGVLSDVNFSPNVARLDADAQVVQTHPGRFRGWEGMLFHAVAAGESPVYDATSWWLTRRDGCINPARCCEEWHPEPIS